MKVGIIVHSLESARKVLEYDSEFDAYELRVDTFENNPIEEIERIRSVVKKPCIYTLRSVSHGGKYAGDPYFLLELARMHPEFLDVEYDVAEDIFDAIPGDVPLILSYHNFDSTPEDLETTAHEMMKRVAVRYKIACMPQSSIDAMRLLELARKKPEFSVIAMGKDGAFTRVIAPLFGDMLQFIAVHGSSAPGQFSINELLQVYNYNRLSQRTRIYALLGDPVDKSYSHITHNAVFSQMQIDAVYVKIRVAQEDMASFLSLAKKLPFYGFSITMPLKRHFSFQPVNTLRRDKDHWKTKNTDGVGALNAIERALFVKGKNVLILGAGGAAHAIAEEAIQRGAAVRIANRTLETAYALASQLGCEAGSINDRIFCSNYDILINCTPLGMKEAKLPLPMKWILPGTVIFDSISNPQITPLLKEAQKLDCTIISGIEMFILQAVEQFLFWFPELKKEARGIERIIRQMLEPNSTL